MKIYKCDENDGAYLAYVDGAYNYESSWKVYYGLLFNLFFFLFLISLTQCDI